MQNLDSNYLYISLPFALAIAWISGEFLYKWAKIPKLSIYVVVGFLLTSIQPNLFQYVNNNSLQYLVSIAFGLILFECGYRVNLRWLVHNPLIYLTALVEAIAIFVIIYLIAGYCGLSTISSITLAIIAMSSSPSIALKTINATHSSGQVSERMLHLTTLNGIIVVVMFKILIGIGIFQSSNAIWTAMRGSILDVFSSIIIGIIFAIMTSTFIKKAQHNSSKNITLTYTIAIILCAVITTSLGISSLLATLMFGLTSRHLRVGIGAIERDFGVLGELLTIVVFFLFGAAISWNNIINGIGLAMLLITVRSIVKCGIITSLSYKSGISLRKGFLTSIATTPISVFIFLFLAKTKNLNIDFGDSIDVIAALTLILGIIGPIITAKSLSIAKETK